MVISAIKYWLGSIAIVSPKYCGVALKFIVKETLSNTVISVALSAALIVALIAAMPLPDALSLKAILLIQ